MIFSVNSGSTRHTCWISLCAALFSALPQLGLAMGTPSGIPITNFANVGYVIGTSPAASTTSNTVQFVVDKKINLVVTETSGKATKVNSGQQKAVTTFTVTNLGNDPQGFDLSAAVAAGNPAVGGAAPFTTNDFNVSIFGVFVDNPAAGGTAGVYDAAFDTATTIPNLAADATSPIVFVVSDIPNPLTGQQSVVSLTATAIPLSGNPALPTPIAALAQVDTASGVETVYADAGGTIDTMRDGKYSAYSAYATGPVVTLTKTIISAQPTTGNAVQNPLDGDATLRPGSILTYQIIARISGVGTIDHFVITDPIPAEITYLPGSIKVDGSAKTDSTTDTDNVGFSGNTISILRGTINAPSADILIQFQATIN